MLNVISIILGLVALLLAIPSAIPFLGIGNWIVLPCLAISANCFSSGKCVVFFRYNVSRIMRIQLKINCIPHI